MLKYVVGLVLLALAVGGAVVGYHHFTQPAPMLYLANGDVTESAMTLTIRTQFAQNPAGTAALCAQLKGLSASDATAVINGSASKPLDLTQLPDKASVDRVSAIILQECERVYGH